ncbi:Inhibitory regulator protein BUD2/CLA2 [Nakaseomyces bracarensis]|uniref:Inhibitory regulator protein BUD2/CLA2 n=1 Tax=Nakaseomyces bracarensis TaxID=273131 RepID=A0ABR4P0G0_9SACH
MLPTDQLKKEFTSSKFSRLVRQKKGCFIGKVDWASHVLRDWKSHYLQVTEYGVLTHAIDAPILNSGLMRSGNGLAEPKHPIIKHLHKCRIRLLESDRINASGPTPVPSNLPVIEVVARTPIASKEVKVYLRVTDLAKFQELLVALVWWSTFNIKGISEKICIQTPEYLLDEEEGSELYLSREENLSDDDCFEEGGNINDVSKNLPQNVLNEAFTFNCNVYGPIPFDANVTTLKDISNIDKYLSQSSFIDAGSLLNPDHQWNSSNFSWFKAKCILKKDGMLDITIDGILVYSLDVKSLLSSEVRKINGHIYNDNCLYIGHLAALRSKINYIGDNLLQGAGLDNNHQALLLHSKNRSMIEELYMLLQLFTSTEQLSLTGAARSNTLRLVNNLEVMILEGSLDSTAGLENGTLFVDVVLWDKIFARTPFVPCSKKPFWREVFEFTESIIPDRLQFDLKCNYEYKQEIIGRCVLSREMIHGTMVNKETRVPIFSTKNPEQEVGNLCLKVTSRKNYILPPENFKNVENSLKSINMKYLTDFAYGDSIGTSTEVEKCALTFLNIFQSLRREENWCSTLITKELEDFNRIMANRDPNSSTPTPSINSLFRGNSVLSKTLEIYFLRVGKEYLEKAFGDIIYELLKQESSFELDPARLIAETDKEKEEQLSKNENSLLKWVRVIWNRILETSNDLPQSIKNQLQQIRKGFEIVALEKNQKIVLQCISVFLFLRFFCPLFLNPKLFKFTEGHLSMQQTRNMLLLTKVLHNLSTLNEFGTKEAWLERLNPFIVDLSDEVTDYIDKVTGKKLDFSSKILDLSDDPRTSLARINKNVLPYMKFSIYGIDKYQDETEFIELIITDKLGAQNNIKNERASDFDGLEDWTTMDEEKPFIGELEFEEITEDNLDVFGDDLMKFLREHDSPKIMTITSKLPSLQSKKVTKKDFDIFDNLGTESELLVNKLDRLLNKLSDYEYPSVALTEREKFITNLINNTYYTRDRFIIVNLAQQFNRDGKFMSLFTSSGQTELFEIFTKVTERARPTNEPTQRNQNRNTVYGSKKSSSGYGLNKNMANGKTEKSTNHHRHEKDDKKLAAATRFSRWLKKKI